MALGVILAGLSACGGGGGGTTQAAASSEPTIGASGGTVSLASGARVIIPPGAIDTPTTIRIAMDSTGAPALPADLPSAGNMYMITPHGGNFAQPVEVRIPVPTVTLQPNQEFKLAKAQPGGEWQILSDSVLTDGFLVAQVNDFSFFAGVIVSYPTGLPQSEPFRFTRVSIVCSGQQPCDQLIGNAITVTITTTTNSGQLPSFCVPGSARIQIEKRENFIQRTGGTLPISGGSWSQVLGRSDSHLTYALLPDCQDANSFRRVGFASVGAGSLTWRRAAQYPDLRIAQSFAHVDIVPGAYATVDVILSGGASGLKADNSWRLPSATNRAVIDWQRSDDNGTSWYVTAHSYQNEANPLPFGVGDAWRFWSVGHGFMAAATDQGALIRIHACYTPPDVPAPPCVTSAATRLNVLLQSDLPAITSMPNAMLVRTGQTASLSATATGAPAPTLQWQTRAANATGAWTNVNTGTGGTTGNYTTPVLTTADNGTQFRVVASNAVGIAESAPVTVSVSDIDVAPTIGTQPASLSVAIGSDAAFAIAARGTEALSYQWQLNGTAITGANSPVLRLPAVSAPQGGSYTVVVSNAAGTVTSTAATLTVTAGTPNAVAPTIVTQPVAVAVNAGNTATFAAGVAGSGPFTYQWRKNGALITGATDAFYSIAAAVVGDAGAYSVAISSPAGNITSNAAALSVTPAAAVTAVAISTQPSPQVQIPGGSATFAVAASGSGPIGYQWLKNGTAMSGATAAVLTLNGLTGADAASYSVTVTGALGSVTSNAASLTVLGAPLIGTQPAAASAIEGASASFSVTASGTALGYQWTRNGVAIGGATAASYTTPALTLADNGAVYAVVVYNGAGVVISTGAALTVTSSAVTYPINVYVNYTATSSVVLQNNGGDTLTVNSDTTGHFATRIAAGAAFNVTVLTPPPGQTCTVVSGSGTAPQGPTTQINCARIPPVVAAAGMNKIAASPSQHTCAIKADGTVACWGNNSSREVTPLNGFNQDLPVVVPGLSNMVQVAVGNQNSCAIDNTGVVSCWGGSRTSIVKLKDGNGSDLTGATSLALGGYHGCLIDASSSVRCWGDNSVGQLGQGTMTGNAVTPVAVQRFGGTALTSVVSLAAGDFHTCALTFTGEVVCWGRGAIGDGSPVVDGLTYTGTQRALQAVTPAISAGANAITSGGNHSCAAMVAGGVKCWGFNLKSQLGDLGTTNQLLPVDVNDAAGLLTGVTLLAAQNNNTCAIPASGKVVCWGSVQPSSGAITYSPTVQGNMTQAVTALASGWNHSCILAADGSAECWGSNNNGQLGIGGTISVNTGGPFPGQGTSVIGGAVFWR